MSQWPSLARKRSAIRKDRNMEMVLSLFSSRVDDTLANAVEPLTAPWRLLIAVVSSVSVAARLGSRAAAGIPNDLY